MADSFWWCNRCLSRVDSKHVTFHEYHDGCGGTCEVLDEEPDVFAAARAWQALRDWLDGTPEQWQDVLDESLMFEYQAGWDAGTLMIQSRCVAWQMVINFLNGTPEQWQERVRGRINISGGSNVSIGGVMIIDVEGKR